MRRRLEGPGEAGEAAPLSAPSAAAPSDAVVAEPEPTGAPATGTPEPALGGPPAASGRPEPAAAAASGESRGTDRRTEGSPPSDGGNVLDLGPIGGAAAGRAALRTLRRPGFWVGFVLMMMAVLWLVLR
jgi:hypothetical protein